MKSTLHPIFALCWLCCSVAAAFAQTTVPTIEELVCPPIQQDERHRTNYPGESTSPVTLVVLGTVKAATGSEKDVYEVDVEKTLYGSRPGKTVRFSWEWSFGPERQIVALAPSVYSKAARYDFRYALPADDEKSQRQLAVARLDYHALAADTIFVGRETAASKDNQRLVVADRVVTGRPLSAGTSVIAEIYGDRRSDVQPVLHAEPMLYLIKAVRQKKGEAAIYGVDCRLPVDQEAAVREALTHRDRYPVKTFEELGQSVTQREITFQGTIADAIEMMGSSSEASRTFSARALIRVKPAALEPVTTAIEGDLFQQSAPQEGRFRRLCQLIRLLKSMDEGGKGGRVEALLGHCVAATSTSPRLATTRPAGATYSTAEEDRDDVNHAVPWLVTALDPKVADDWGPRLIKARDAAAGPWKDELQLALTATDVLDHVEMRAAVERMKGRPPVTGRAFSAMSGGPVAFSADGSLLAAGTLVWRTNDWSSAGGFESPGSIAGLFFSADGKSIYLAGGGRMEILGGYDWKSGQILRRFTGLTAGVEWAAASRDRTTLATLTTGERELKVWDTATGTLRRAIDVPDHCYHAALSADATLLAFEAGDGVTVMPLTGGAATRLAGFRYEIDEMAFSPDGRSLVCTDFDLGSDQIGVAVYDVGPTANFHAKTTLSGFRCTRMAIAPDGGHVVVGDQNGKAWVLDLPDLKNVRSLSPSGGNEGGFAFSPDGKLLAIGDNYAPVRLYRGDTFAPVPIEVGHPGKIESVSFAADESQIRTLGTDGTTCLWDAKTLGILGRGNIPAGSSVLSHRDDGKYLLCVDAATEKNASTHSEEAFEPMLVVDADTSKVVSTTRLPLGQYGSRIHWVDSRQAVMATWKHLCRFDYLTGQILKDVAIDDTESGNGRGDLIDGGKSLLMIDGGLRSPVMKLETLDLETGQSRPAGRQDLPVMTGNRRGVVPGGKYFYIGDPGLLIYDRETTRPVGTHPFAHSDIFGLAFSGDGSRLAAAVGSRIYIENDFRQLDDGESTWVRVQETTTGRTICAVPSRSRWIKALGLAPSGRRFAVVTDDGTLAVWDIGI